MATRAVLQVFERYQKERVTFVSTVAEMSKNPQVRCSHGLHPPGIQSHHSNLHAEH